MFGINFKELGTKLHEKITHQGQRKRLMVALEIIRYDAVADEQGGRWDLSAEAEIVVTGTGKDLSQLETNIRNSISSWALLPAETAKSKSPRLKLGRFRI